MLRMLSGKQHWVFTGFTIKEPAADKEIMRSVETKVFFGDLSDGDINDYVATGEPLDKAGAYAIQAEGRRLVARVEGSLDNVVGLPTVEVTESLKEFGVFPQ